MLIDSEKLKESINKFRLTRNDDIIERCFNQGLCVSVKIIQIFEEAEMTLKRK